MGEDEINSALINRDPLDVSPIYQSLEHLKYIQTSRMTACRHIEPHVKKRENNPKQQTQKISSNLSSFKLIR